ncbi:MAG: hypothetical protein EA376_01725, partial [Phycisphaeraceae bacterium]
RAAEDERAWKAEEMLRAVIEQSPPPDAEGVSTRRRIERYLDALEREESASSPSESPSEPETLPDDPRAAASTPQTPDSDAVPPIQVPGHELLCPVPDGRGGFGQVWIARHSLLKHDRACKLIERGKAIELEGLRLLKQRISSHPNLFPIEEVGEVGAWLYCLMPLAESASTSPGLLDPSGYRPLTLGAFLKREGKRAPCEAAAIGAELAEGLRHLHTQDVTHGDIKPANILRLGERWALADYGLLRDGSSPRGEGHTPGYTPPEGPGSEQADQYALGVVLMALLMKWPPKKLSEFREIATEQLKLDEAGAQLREIILRATAKDPRDRFDSAAELAEALRALAHEPAQTAEPPLKQPWKRWAPAIAALAVLALLFMIVPNLFPKSEPIAADAPDAAAAPSPLRIESFEVQHYRYDPIADLIHRVGPISADNPAARADDDVTIHARFTTPVHFYLLSLDADGRVRPRVPASPTEAPAPADSLDYPSDPAADPEGYLFNLSAGPGAQGFMLLVSDDPLPPWSDWIATRGEPTWSRETLPASGVILFDGVETRYASAMRDPMPRRGAIVLDPIDWAKSQSELVDIRFIAFPVLPNERN